MLSKKSPSIKQSLITLTASCALTVSAAKANTLDFSLQEISAHHGHSLEHAEDKDSEGKCGSGQCGVGKCGAGTCAGSSDPNGE